MPVQDTIIPDGFVGVSFRILDFRCSLSSSPDGSSWPSSAFREEAFHATVCNLWNILLPVSSFYFQIFYFPYHVVLDLVGFSEGRLPGDYFG